MRSVKILARATIVTVTISAIFFTTAAAQSCPQIDSFQLIKSTYAGWTINFLRCGPRDEGGVMCFITCAYQPVADRGQSFYTQGYWYTQPPPNRPYYPEMCNPNPPSNTFANTSRQIKVLWGDVNNENELGAAQTVARQLFSFGEPQAVPCPGTLPSGGPDRRPDNESACTSTNRKLQELNVLSTEIDEQLNYLIDYRQKETVFRDSLSYYNRLIAALNTPNYNGELRDEVRRLQDDPNKRANLAMRFGLDPNLDAISLARATRDIIVAKIEYIADAPTFRQRFLEQKLLNDVEIAKLKGSMSNLQCRLDLTGNNCEISGHWEINGMSRWGQAWSLHSTSAARYEGYGNGGGWISVNGTAEVFGKEIILRFSGTELGTSQSAGSYKIRMNDECTRGDGELRLAGRAGSVPVTMSRDRSESVRKLVPDAMYEIEYNGKVYPVLYQRGTHQGTPIDLFYFKILETNGQQVRQDGEELWGRFVRHPSLDHPNQETVETWVVNWLRNGARWVADQRKNERFILR